ncbi:30S ribosomal protein S20 [soil metagenome]
MANLRSQIKRNRQNEVRRNRNRAGRSELRTLVNVAAGALGEGSEQGAEALRLAVKRIDMAAAKGVLHKNNAARRKSRLMKAAARAASTEA